MRTKEEIEEAIQLMMAAQEGPELMGVLMASVAAAVLGWAIGEDCTEFSKLLADLKNLDRRKKQARTN